MYINCKTWFSFRYGTFETEALVKEAAELGVSSMALTNINSTCDIWDFVYYCRDHGISPVAGAEIRNGDHLLYILLARDNDGLHRINRFLSAYLESGERFPARPIMEESVYVIYPAGSVAVEELNAAEYIGIQLTETNRLQGLGPAALARFVIRHPVTFRNKTSYNVHRLLRAIDDNILLSKQDKTRLAGEHEYFMEPKALLEAFARYPAVITNTLRLLESCSIEMEYHTDKTKKTYSASIADDRALLAKLALDGLQRRYGSEHKAARERLLRELSIIDTLGFNAYFLITWDIVRYAQSRGFFYVGRGSGANSIVAYCLRITDVDPIELNLYFERFLNPYRSSPPDFDIDFSWKDRDEVIDYIFKRYGREHVCQLGCYVTFQKRAVLRELGKVFGLPKEEIDKMEYRSQGEDEIQRRILHYAELIRNFPSHVSIHAGGILITEEPVHRHAATFVPPKGFPVCQLDMFIAEKTGLFKLDILSQRGLGHIRDTVSIVRRNKGEQIDIHDVEKFKNDPEVQQRIHDADTIGCFYVESPAMRQLLRKLRCRDYITLVAASSIIRPGVAQSGMMRAYIQRYHHPDSFEYLHPILEELLSETYGVMVFQEDVIKVAHYFGGLDLGEADILRRGMSGKYRSSEQFLQVRDRFFDNCKDRGYTEELSREVWRQMESFAGYSFNKAHSASFAVESFQSLYLKTYYPKEFLVAVINNFGGFYSQELYFLELRKTGASIHPPCVNRSETLTRISGNEVYTGFVHIKSLPEDTVETLLSERRRGGPFLHFHDFMERTHPPAEAVNILISAGAFRFTGKSKKELLWEANFLQKNVAETVPGGLSMFQEPPRTFSLPALSHDPVDDIYDEVELLGFPLRHPFELCTEHPAEYTPASRLAEFKGRQVTTLLYFIDRKIVPTGNGQTMAFGSFVDAQLDWVDTVHFPASFSRYPLQGRGFYKVSGKVTEDFGVYSIEVNFMQKLGYKQRKSRMS
jgi:DNA polymerase-3 subunit alpha